MKLSADQAIDVARVVFLVVGVSALVRGAWLAWAPGGWLVLGAAFVAVALAGAVQRPGKG